MQTTLQSPLILALLDPAHRWIFAGLGMLFGLFLIFFALTAMAITDPEKKIPAETRYSRMLFWTSIGMLVFAVCYMCLLVSRQTV